MYIEKPFPGVIRIITSKPSILDILVPFIFPLIWIWALVGEPSTLDGIVNGISELSGLMWVFVLVPMPLVFVGALALLRYIVGLNYDFDERKQEVLRNGKLIARFNELERVHVSRDKSVGGSYEYGLELYIKGRRRPLVIDTSTDAANVVQAADSIQTMIGEVHTGLQSETTARQKMVLSPGQIPQRVTRALSIILAVGGLAAIGVGVYMFVDTLEFLRTCRETPGTVIDNIPKRDSEGHVTYAAEVRFVTTEDSHEVVFVSNTSSTRPSYSTGESVVVLYQEGDPTDARIKSFSSLWFLPILICFFGAVFLTITVYLSWFNRRTT